ncbi:putative transposase [Nonlabens dokdonensis]|uniref:Transposase IS200-family protein n=2 Tax=Nonlabens dokdonensis TaxID=328515 RepID=L7W673_NONDD|nr:IS200/IS605 family transposase [Nonlabens dokdonensis]AGC77180.1 transposase IS200-family protein [Nonlabens dokdonensis DSW-6]PZX41138.1 putative transposase [Nonlabens dokdonensis]
MSRNNLQLYIHLFFVTKYRDYLITDRVESKLHQFLWNKSLELGLTPLMINGIQDHVHLLIKIPSTITVAAVVKKLKAPNSRFLNELTQSNYFEWSRGYEAFTVSKIDISFIAEYIRNQKMHHSNGTVNSELELSSHLLPKG